MSEIRFLFSGSRITACGLLFILVFYPLLLESNGCSFSKWQRQQIQLVWDMAEKRSENFLGLGKSAGAASWDEALTDAKLEAEAALSENVQVYVKTLNRLVSESINTKSTKEVNEKLNEFSLSVSETTLRKVEYSETGRLYCDSKYYVAMTAIKNKADYFKDYIKYVPTSTAPLLNELFKNTDKEFLQEFEKKTGK